MQTEKEIETITVATRITKPMHEAMAKILASNSHLNTADYVRDLIRRDLETRSVLKEKEPKK